MTAFLVPLGLYELTATDTMKYAMCLIFTKTCGKLTDFCSVALVRTMLP